jgi:hypothetical protein
VKPRHPSSADFIASVTPESPRAGMMSAFCEPDFWTEISVLNQELKSGAEILIYGLMSEMIALSLAKNEATLNEPMEHPFLVRNGSY